MKKLFLGGEALYIGSGSLKRLADLACERTFIVTGGHSMFANGTIGRIEEMLQQQGCCTTVYSGIKKNPDTQAVLAGLQAMQEYKPDTLIAVGGGSAIDAAKVMALFYEYDDINFTNILTIGDLPETRHKLRFIAIPSTSGTGSEVTRAAVITFDEQQLKIGLKAGAMVPDIAILDADITLSMPVGVVAETGMDAMTHAVECYINTACDDFSEVLARGAVQGIFHWLPLSYRDNTIASRAKMHNYQCMAGLAFASTGLGMAHGIAHAIGGAFDLGHGLTNAIVLPFVLRFNSRDADVQAKLARLAGEIGHTDFIAAICDLDRQLAIPDSLRAAGIAEQDFYGGLAGLVDNALKGSTRSNPVQVTSDDMAGLLKSIYEGNLGAEEA